MKEEGVEFTVAKNVFYNPNMEFCRSICSLAVGAIEEKIIVCDGFAASGIRGIRYATENKNVKKTIFVDIEKNAIACAKKNAKKNKIKFEAKCGNFSRLVFDIVADFVEIDPFGSPAPYLYDAFRIFNPLKKSYLSVTATDTAVLCGAKLKACIKNYHSKPLNNEFTHENGLRILIKKIVETAAEFNLGAEPLISLSDRHYLKAIIKFERSADAAYKSMKKLGYVNYCLNCGFREASEFPLPTCKLCNKNVEYAGPLWLGELHKKEFIERMIALNRKRNYKHKDEIAKKLSLMLGEVDMPPYYYNVHELCSRLRANVPKIEILIECLIKKGFRAVRTHFNDVSIKTDAKLEEIEKILRVMCK
jgi:tRNA (guanine26-N2/guanine27-N2)-dimethyltransferase